ncbi:MAG TPA: four-carbon acid sugar kinase family protein [Alphaproteobacteria bacterium]
MRSICILADDLTGALDTAAPLAGRYGVMPVRWRPPFVGPRLVIDSETRSLAPHRAAFAVAHAAARLSGPALGFKKIDSLLRGNTLLEIATCVRRGRFGTVVIAPAFPEQGRITRAGVQLYRDPANGGWRQTGAGSILRALAAKGIRARIVPRRCLPRGPGIFICDAETPSDLDRIVSLRSRLDGPILWIGSAGLSRALAQFPRPLVPPSTSSVLVVVGSNHPVAVGQGDVLASGMPEAIARISHEHAIDTALRHVARRLAARRPGAILFSLPPMSAAAAAEIMNRTFARIPDLVPPPDILLVVGGDTLVRLAGAVGASQLDVHGEIAPGLPLSLIADGAWRGTYVISKSGAFGGPRLLLEIVTAIRKKGPEDGQEDCHNGR